MRCVVVGTSGAGKSSFAAALAARLGCRHHELDELFWGPDWTPKPTPEFVRLAAEAARGECWVIDGNFSITREVVWSRATHIVWLDYGRATVMWRILCRTLARVASGRPLWHGNRERWRKAFFSRESIIVWSATTFDKNRRRYGELMRSGPHAHLQWERFGTPREAARYLQGLGG